MPVCVVWGNTQRVILIVEAPPCCLCFYWSTYGHALHPRPSIPPFVVRLPLVYRCSVLLSVALAGLTVHSGTKDGSELILCSDPVLWLKPDQTDPFQAVWLQKGSAAGGRVKPSGSWSLKWPCWGLRPRRHLLSTRRHFSQAQQRQCLMMSLISSGNLKKRLKNLLE